MGRRASSTSIEEMRDWRLSVPFSVSFVLNIWCLLHLFQEYKSFPIHFYSLSTIRDGRFCWTNLPAESKVCLVLIASHCLLMFLLFVLSAPFLDCLFTSVSSSLRLLSFYLTVLTFRDFGVFADLLQLASAKMVPDIGKYCLFIFAVEPVSPFTASPPPSRRCCCCCCCCCDADCLCTCF